MGRRVCRGGTEFLKEFEDFEKAWEEVERRFWYKKKKKKKRREEKKS